MRQFKKSINKVRKYKRLSNNQKRKLAIRFKRSEKARLQHSY